MKKSSTHIETDTGTSSDTTRKDKPLTSDEHFIFFRDIHTHGQQKHVHSHRHDDGHHDHTHSHEVKGEHSHSHVHNEVSHSHENDHNNSHQVTPHSHRIEDMSTDEFKQLCSSFTPEEFKLFFINLTQNEIEDHFENHLASYKTSSSWKEIVHSHDVSNKKGHTHHTHNHINKSHDRQKKT